MKAARQRATIAAIAGPGGRFIEPSPASVRATPDAAYPIVATAYGIAARSGGSGARARAFFHWALSHGQARARELGYLPAPDTAISALVK